MANNRERPNFRRPVSDLERNAEAHVYDYVLTAMEAFAGQDRAIDEPSLVKICMAGNCPSPTKARTIIQKMVFKGLLRIQILDGKKSYFLPPPPAVNEKYD